MVKLTVDLPEDLALWLAADAATRGCSRQDLVVEMLRDEFERSEAVIAIAERAAEKHRELLRRLAEC